MQEMIYLYNIALIILYSMALAFSILQMFKKENETRTLFAAIAIYLLFFILDNLILSMTEVISSFGFAYNQASYGVPIAKTIIFLVNNTCQLWIVTKIRHTKMTYLQYALVLLNFVWMLIPLSEPSTI